MKVKLSDQLLHLSNGNHTVRVKRIIDLPLLGLKELNQVKDLHGRFIISSIFCKSDQFEVMG